MMDFGACVSVSYEENGNLYSASSSGIFLPGRYVITSSSVLRDILQPPVFYKIYKQLRNIKYMPSTEFSTIFEDLKCTAYVSKSKIASEMQISLKENTIQLNKCTRPLNNKTDNCGNCFQCKISHWDPEVKHEFPFPCNAYFMGLFYAAEIDRDVSNLSFINNGSISRGNAKMEYKNLIEEECSMFLIFSLNDKPDDHSFLANELKRFLQQCDLPKIGVPVYVESTPFGDFGQNVFFNSISEGVVSNMTRPDGCIFLTDARCIMGTEGGITYAKVLERYIPIGIVILAHFTSKKTWYGMSLVASLKPLLQSMAEYFGVGNWNPQLNLLVKDKFLENALLVAEKATVLVKTLHGTGTGVIVSANPCLILTCAHVVYKHDQNVTIILYNGSTHSAKVLHKTIPYSINTNSCQPWDVAVLSTDDLGIVPLQLRDEPLKKGERIYSYGYGTRSFNSPSLSKGIVSKVIQIPRDVIHYNPQLFIQSKSFQKPQSSQLFVSNTKDVCLIKQEPLFCRTVDNSDINSNQRMQKTNDFTDYNSSNKLYSPTKCELDNDNSLSKCRTIFNSDTLNHIIFNKKANIFKGKETEHVIKQNDCFKKDDCKISLPEHFKRSPLALLLETSCVVRSGDSGGPLLTLNETTGFEVAGIMVCNMCDLSNETTYLHVNHSIPSIDLHHIINAYLKHDCDARYLELLSFQSTTGMQLTIVGKMNSKL